MDVISQNSSKEASVKDFLNHFPLQDQEDGNVSLQSSNGTSSRCNDYGSHVSYQNSEFGGKSSTSVEIRSVDFDLNENAFGQIHTSPSQILPIPYSRKPSPMNNKESYESTEKSLWEMGFNANEVAGWEEIRQPPKDNLYLLLRNMIDHSIKPDVMVRIGSAKFHVHWMVLKCYSEFFMECDNELLVELPAEKITPEAFVMVYKWMTADEPQIERERILELFMAAKYLKIKQLEYQCWICLDDNVCFREETAFLLYLEARNYNLKDVQNLMLARICKFFLTLVASKEFLSLSPKEICTLLSLNSIGVNSEIEILMAAVRWLSYNWQEREPYILDVIKCVRFSLMPAVYLVTLNNDIDFPELERIIGKPEVKKMISDGISYTTTKSFYGHNREEFLQTIERYNLEKPMLRVWIFDDQCNYHCCLKCPNFHSISYTSFLEYLDMIRTIGKDYWRSLQLSNEVKNPLQCCSNCLAPLERKLNEKMFLCKNRYQGVHEADGMLTKIERANYHRKIVIKFKHFKHYKSSISFTPKRYFKYSPSIITTTPHMNNDNATETEIEAIVNFECPYGFTTEVKDNAAQLNNPQQTKNNVCNNKKRHSTDVMMKRGHLAKSPSPSPLPWPSVVCLASDMKDCKQHPQLPSQLKLSPKAQGMKQNQFETESMEVVEATNASCTVIYKRVTLPNMSADSLTEQCRTSTCLLNNNDILTRNNDDDGGDNVAIIAQKQIGDENLGPCRTDPIDWKRRISNRRIILFGGIDAYFMHSQQEQQHLQFPGKHHRLQWQQFLGHWEQHKRTLSLDENRNVVSPTQPMNKTAIANVTKNTNAATMLDNGKDNKKNNNKHNKHTSKHCHFPSASLRNKHGIFGDQVFVYGVGDGDGDGDANSDASEWRHLSHIPFGPRHRHAVVACNGLIYLVGGVRPTHDGAKKSIFENSVWCFDPQTLKWTVESNLPESTCDFAVVSLDKRKCSRCKGTKSQDEPDRGFYIIGGRGSNGKILNTVWFYNIKRKQWFKKPSLNMGRYGLTAAMVNNEIWIAGGITNSQGGGRISNDNDCDTNVDRERVGGGGVNGKIGVSGSSSHTPLAKMVYATANVITDTMEIYTLQCSHENLAHNWPRNAEEGFENIYTAAHMVEAIAVNTADAASAVAIASHDDCGVDGHDADNGDDDDAFGVATAGVGEMCDCIMGQWIKSKLRLRVPRVFGKFCKMPNGDLYLVGGMGVDKAKGHLTSMSDIDRLEVKQQQWQHYGDLNWPRHGHDVGLLNDHCFVVIGGVSSMVERTLRQVETFCTNTRKSLKDVPDLPWPVSGSAVATLE
uniref:BTB domain-containing protein n=1 Tax=Stomoxys calcitrans TaxID=35570 RepID=A0A1I8PEI8_STOCA